MKNLLKKLQEPPVVIEIYSEKMVFTVLDHDGNQTNQITVLPEKPYKSERMLIGYFDNALTCVKKASKQLGYSSLKRPPVIIKPKEMLVGGLSLVEERALKELSELFWGVNVKVVVE